MPGCNSDSLESLTPRLVRINVARVSWPGCPEKTPLFSIENMPFITKIALERMYKSADRIAKILKRTVCVGILVEHNVEPPPGARHLRVLQVPSVCVQST